MFKTNVSVYYKPGKANIDWQVNVKDHMLSSPVAEATKADEDRNPRKHIVQ